MSTSIEQPAPKPRPRVLVVDDDPANRALCAVTLTKAGYDVVEAEDGERGLELACSLGADMALLDVRMPKLDGFELAEALRRDPRTQEIPFAFVSAETRPETHARARSVGAAGYLVKPFDPGKLEALVATIAGERPLYPH